MAVTSGSVKISIKIDGENKAGGALRDADKALRKVEEAAKKAARAATLITFESAIALAERFGAAISKAWDFAREGEKANNIQFGFERAVKRSTEALEGARKATAGLYDDTTLQTRLISLQRLNLSIADQGRVLEAVTKISTSSGDAEARVFKSVLGAIQGKTTALEKWGIQLNRGTDALDQLDASLVDIRLEDLQTSIQRADTAWANLVSTMQQEVSNALDSAVKGVSATTTAMVESMAAMERQNRLLAEIERGYFQATIRANGFWEATGAVTKEARALEAVRLVEFIQATTGANITLADETLKAAAAFGELRESMEDLPTGRILLPGHVPAKPLAPVAVTPRPRRTGTGRRRPRVDPELEAAKALRAEVEFLAGVEIKARDAALAERKASEELALSRLLASQESLGVAKEDLGLAVQAQVAIRQRIVLAEHETALKRVSVELEANLLTASEARSQREILRLQVTKQTIDLEREAAGAIAQAAEAGGSDADAAIEKRIDQFERLGGIMGDVAATAADSESSVVSAIGGMLQALDSQAATIKEGGAEAIAASGKVAAATIKDTRAQAAIQGAFEVAASIAAFASQDYLGGVLHAGAAALYFATAGGGGGGGASASGAGGGAQATQAAPRPARAVADTDSAAPATIVMHINTPLGVVGGNPQEVGTVVQRTARAAQASGFA